MFSIKLNKKGMLEVKIETYLGDLQFKHVLKFMSSLPGVEYVPDKYKWMVPREYIDRLVSFLGEENIAWWNSIEEIKGIEEVVLPQFTVTDEGLEDLKVKPYPFQVVGISFLHDIKCGILADDVGLGKTIQSIAATHRLWKEGKVEKVLVVCPSSVKYQWVNAIHEFTDHKAIAIDGNDKERKRQIFEFANSDYLFAVISYDGVRSDVDTLKQLCYDVIIADELHRIKNYNTKVSQALKQLDAPFKFGLTGTPIQNEVEEIFSLFEWINPMIFGNYWKFRNRYIVTAEKYNKKGVRIGYKNLGELRKIVGSYVLRRTQEDVKQQLPDIVYNTYRVPMTPEQQRLQEAIQADMEEFLEKMREEYANQSQDTEGIKNPKEDQMLGFVNLLSAVANTPELLRMSDSGMVKKYLDLLNKDSKCPKLDELEAICREQIETGSSKVVIFTRFARMQKLIVDRLEQKLGKCVIINGAMSPAERQAAVDQFRNDEDIYFLVATDAANAGVNLQVAGLLVNVDLPWNPAIYTQRAGRIRRLGSKFDTVRVINLITEGSIDERIERALIRKQKLASQIVEKNNLEKQIISTMPFNLLSEITSTTGKRRRRKSG